MESIIAKIKQITGIKSNAVIAREAGVAITVINHCTAPKSREKYERVPLLKKVFNAFQISASFHNEKPDITFADAMQTGDGLWVTFKFIPNYPEYAARCRRIGVQPFRLQP